MNRKTAIALALSLLATHFASAAVPLRWTVETSRLQPAVFDVIRGETLDLEASFNSYGTPVSTSNMTAFLCWQTNGMASAWWMTNAVTTATVARVRFTPEMDPGAPVVHAFLGLSDSTNQLPSTNYQLPSLSYRAAFTIRFRHGPGAAPNVIASPVPILDLAHTVVVNPPWPTQADFAATTTVMRAELKDYVDGQIGSAGLVTPQSVTNVVTNVVTKAYVESLGIESGLDTNAVAAVITNHVTSGYLAKQTDVSTASAQTLASAISASAAMTNNLSSDVRHLKDLNVYVTGWNFSDFKKINDSNYHVEDKTNEEYEYLKYVYRYGNYGSRSLIAGGRVLYRTGRTPVFDIQKVYNADYESLEGGRIYFDGVVKTNDTLVTLNEIIGTSVTNGGALAAAQAMTNAMEAAGTDRQIVRGKIDSERDIWDVRVGYADHADYADFVDWGNVQDTPESLGGYGITDAYTKTQADARYAPTSTADTVSSHTSQLTQQSQQLAAIGAHLNAEDAHFVSTNYDSVVNIPEAYVEIKMNNAWITIWREMTRWTKFVGNAFDWNSWGGFYNFLTYVMTELSAKADKCWGIYDSETGEYSPDGFTQISSSNILIAANMSYKRTVTIGGAVWVLQCNSGTAHIGGETNGFFRIKDSDGVTQFEIIKGNKQELGADADGITVDPTTVPPTVTIPYSVEATDHPTLQICDDLSTAQWKAETDASCVANVSWSGGSGAYVATVQRKTAGDKLFVKASYMSVGETYIHNVAPVGMDSIMLNGTKYYLGTAVIGGNTVLTLSTTPQTP